MRRHKSGPVRVPLLGRNEDFGPYRPEGHYRQSEPLQRYHAAMTWLRRVGLLLRSGPIAPDDAPRQVQAASLIARALEQARLPDGRSGRAAWERIATVASFYLGLADDLGAQPGKVPAPAGGKLDGATLQSLELELLKEWPRFTPDGYILDRLVGTEVGTPTRMGQFTLTRTADGPSIRGLPRGLDVMAVLGSSRARELLHDLGDDAYRGYDAALATLQRRFASFDSVDWNRNLAWSWLYALKPLLAVRDSGYPSFMASGTYRTKSLNTALASWAHRRQDVALYAEQSKATEAKALKEIPLAAPPVRGDRIATPYVEPLPDLYARLLAMTRMASAGLRTLDVLDRPSQERLQRLEKLLGDLQTVAEKELAGQVLDADEERFLRRLVEDSESVALSERTTVSLTTVHLDASSGQILQEATGNLDVGIFLYPRPDGRLALAAGPVLSYYEFKRPSAKALTEAEWRRLLVGTVPPPRPPWAASFLAVPRASP
jgi:hypothetical protein